MVFVHVPREVQVVIAWRQRHRVSKYLRASRKVDVNQQSERIINEASVVTSTLRGHVLSYGNLFLNLASEKRDRAILEYALGVRNVLRSDLMTRGTVPKARDVRSQGERGST